MKVCKVHNVDTSYYTADLDECYKHCKQDGVNHFSYGRKESWACDIADRPDQCKCWCFIKGCEEKYNRDIDLYVIVQGA